MPSRPLVTTEEVKLYLGRPTLSPMETMQISGLIAAVGGLLDTVCNRVDILEDLPEDAPIPQDLKYCCLILVASEWHKLDRLGVKSESFGNTSVEYELDTLPWLVQQLLQRHTQFSIA